VVKNTTAEKVGKMLKGVEKNYVNRNEYPQRKALWKSPVEKSVENVEKWRFSTAITAF